MKKGILIFVIILLMLGGRFYSSISSIQKANRQLPFSGLREMGAGSSVGGRGDGFVDIATSTDFYNYFYYDSTEELTGDLREKIKEMAESSYNGSSITYGGSSVTYGGSSWIKSGTYTIQQVFESCKYRFSRMNKNGFPDNVLLFGCRKNVHEWEIHNENPDLFCYQISPTSEPLIPELENCHQLTISGDAYPDFGYTIDAFIFNL